MRMQLLHNVVSFVYGLLKWGPLLDQILQQPAEQ
jgi:hypothetical protein